MKKWRAIEKEKQPCADAAAFTVIKAGVSRRGNRCCWYPGKLIILTNTKIIIIYKFYEDLHFPKIKQDQVKT